MIYPIVAYGDPVLRRVGDELDLDDPGLEQLVEDMYETMYNANGVGLAAPQIGKSVRLFVIDSSGMHERDDESAEEGLKEAFINPIMLEESGRDWSYEEGCLSIPNIVEEVYRQEEIEIEYYNRQLELVTRKFSGLEARVIQHEYDHIEGVLFTDHLKPLKKTLLRSRLKDISAGKVSTRYKMKFPKGKRR